MRSSGPRARSNGRRASGRASRSASPPPARRQPAGRPPAGGAARRRDHLHRRAIADAKVVRSASWRRTISPSAAARARGVAARPAGARRRRCCRPGAPGSSWSRNQSRSWAKESGSGAVARHGREDRRRQRLACRAGAARPRAASARRRGRLEERRAAAARRRRPRAPARRPGWRAASGRRVEEVVVDADPLATPSTSRPDRRRAAPRPACAARRSPAARRRGRLRRGQGLAVDLAVGGERQRRQQRRRPPAPCSSGSRWRRKSRSSAAGGGRRAARHDVGDQPAVAGRSSRGHHHGLAHAGWRGSAASISPSSMRKPRTLTWWSRRPRNSSSPSGRQRARSPVR